jgi:DNA-directed RNA polymerase subunit L
MEINILTNEKNKLIMDIHGSLTKSWVNALRKELWHDPKVKIAGYNVNHPLTGTPQFIVETSGEDAKTAVKAAISRLQKTIVKVRTEANKLK